MAVVPRVLLDHVQQDPAQVELRAAMVRGPDRDQVEVAVRLVADGTISGTIAKKVFEIMLETGDGAGAIVEREGLKQTSDTGAIDTAVDQVLAANADKVAEYQGGKQALFGFFVGQVMKAMQGKANPQMVNERLRAKLDA